VPGWRYDAAATLDFGGAWVTAGASPGRDPTSADLNVTLNGVLVDSPEVALSRHPDSEGVYNLVFSTGYWDRSLSTGNPTVSFAAGTFVSPTLGPIGAFSEPVTLVDCRLPTVARATLLQTISFECAVGVVNSCPSDGIWRAAFVLEIVFSEPVFRVDGSPVTDADLEIYTVGGDAQVSSTYVVQSSGGARRRRLSEAVGTTTLSVAVELGSAANGLEEVQIRAIEGAIRDGSGTWLLSHGDKDVVTAAGNVLEPYPARLASSETATRFPTIGVFVPLGIIGAVALVMFVLCLCCRRHRRNIVKVQVGPRMSTLGARILGSAANLLAAKPQPKPPRNKVAPKPWPNRPRGKTPADALAIAKHYEWLRAKEPYVELTGRWIDTLADAVIDMLRGAQPACALPPGVLKTAHVVHSNLYGGHAPNDLEALRALGKLLRDGPSPLPESLLMAAASLDTSAAAAMGTFGEAEATVALHRVLASGLAVPKAVKLGLGDVALPPVSIVGYAGEADAALKQQLAGLLQQREWHAYARSAVQGLMPACLAAFSSAGLDQPPVATDTDAVTLVLDMVEMHARLGARQREAETRTHRALETPYQAWTRARRGGGFTDLEAAPAAIEVAQVRMRNNDLPVSIRTSRRLQFSQGGLK